MFVMLLVKMVQAHQLYMLEQQETILSGCSAIGRARALGA